ncbi:sigma-70 family RNA polymerase sigma factor [Clostridioides difficile]|nr:MULTISPECIES: sigma-70 family RNA polymerase sigma factor [Clostridioides]MDI2882240.1 sigma-70 family RNA polymerase sigma factor [Clostridioides difficile]MDN9956140.1 sigma-70 family RNA polymerase sigma factor [Clostridioides difficile]UDN49570.1 sigma-70 family RNA polymerase sigma factor [Clostridioides sp. ES-S-0173-01]
MIDKNRELIMGYKAGDKSCLEKLISNNQKYIYKMISKYTIKDSYVEDIFNSAIIGFITAINRYDIKKEANILTYARKYIESEIFEQFRVLTVDCYIPKKKYKKIVRKNSRGVLEKDNCLKKSYSLMNKSICSNLINTNEFDMRITHLELKWAMSELDELEKEVIFYLYIEKKNYKEIEQKLKINLNKISYVRKKALAKLKEKLKQKEVV